MSRTSVTFNAITCKHCGAIVAMLPPGALIYNTRLKCVHCSVIVMITKIVDEQAQNRYTTLKPA